MRINLADLNRLRSPKIKQVMFALSIIAAVSTDGSIAPVQAAAPNAGRAVSAAEANGTFIQDLGKENDHLCNTIVIKSVGPNKLKVSFDLYYPNRDSDGNMVPNVGSAEGTASIIGDTAVYKNNEYRPCKIEIKFTKPGEIKCSQTGECSFGFNVVADGTFKKQVKHASHKRKR